MDLNVIIVLVLMGYVVVGYGLTMYQIKPFIDGWLTMTLTNHQIRVEKRRFLALLAILGFMSFQIREVYLNFNWIYFMVVSIISLVSNFFIYKLEFKSFHNAFNAKKNIKSSAILTEPSYNEYKKNIDIVFSESLFKLLRKYNYLNFSDDFDYDEVNSIILKSDQQVFRFQNRHEAKEFYNRIFKNSNSRLKDYLPLFGYEYRSLRNDPLKNNFSDNFKDFLIELEDL